MANENMEIYRTGKYVSVYIGVKNVSEEINGYK